MPEDSVEFPENILDVLGKTFAEYMPEYVQIRRPLRAIDPAQSLGLFAADWEPKQGSVQMGNQSEPALQRYDLRVQLMVKAGTEVLGRQMFGLGSKTLRVVLYRDPNLIVRLAGLTETLLGTRESFKRFGVDRQRFLNNELQGSFLFLATTHLWLETESLRLS